MNFLKKNNKKILFIGLIILGSFLFAHTARAGIEEWTLGVLNWLLDYVVMALGFIINLLISVLITIAQYNDFINNKAVVNGWVIVRDLCNMFFILILLVIAVATIFRYENYSAKKNLITLILMAVLINFSRMIAGLFIDFAQVLMLTFVAGVSGITSGNILIMLGLENITSVNANSSSPLSATDLFVAHILACLYLVISIVVIVVMVAMLAMRIVFLWIYIVLSPLAYLLGAFPGGKQYSGKWWGEFSKHVITGPVLAFFLWLSFQTAASNTLSNDATGFATAPTTAGTSAHMIKFVISIGLLIGGLIVAGEAGGAGAGLAKSASNKIQGMAKDIGKKAPRKLGGFAARTAGNAVEGTTAGMAMTAGGFSRMFSKDANGKRQFGKGAKEVFQGLGTAAGAAAASPFGINNKLLSKDYFKNSAYGQTSLGKLQSARATDIENVKNKKAQERYKKWLKKAGFGDNAMAQLAQMTGKRTTYKDAEGNTQARGNRMATTGAVAGTAGGAAAGIALGSVLAGPLGAALGGIIGPAIANQIGHFTGKKLDKKLNEKLANDTASNKKKNFFTKIPTGVSDTIFGNLNKAAADSSQKALALNQFMERASQIGASSDLAEAGAGFWAANGKDVFKKANNNPVAANEIAEMIKNSDNRNLVRTVAKSFQFSKEAGSTTNLSNIEEALKDAKNNGVIDKGVGDFPSFANRKNPFVDATTPKGSGKLSIGSDFGKGDINELNVDFEKLNLDGIKFNGEDFDKDASGLYASDKNLLNKISPQLTEMVNKEINALEKIKAEGKVASGNGPSGDKEMNEFTYNKKMDRLKAARDRLSKPENLSNLILNNSASKGYGYKESKLTRFHEAAHANGVKSDETAEYIAENINKNRHYDAIDEVSKEAAAMESRGEKVEYDVVLNNLANKKDQLSEKVKNNLFASNAEKVALKESGKMTVEPTDNINVDKITENVAKEDLTELAEDIKARIEAVEQGSKEHYNKSTDINFKKTKSALENTASRIGRMNSDQMYKVGKKISIMGDNIDEHSSALEFGAMNEALKNID